MTDLAVIFDMDGVLVDSYRPHFESWKHIARLTGVAFTEADFAATFGKTSREILRRHWPVPIPEADVARLDDEKEAQYRRLIRQDFPEMPGAGGLVRALDEAGFRLAVGSSGPRANVETVVDAMGQRARFDALVSGSDVTHGKPDPEIFLVAARKLGLPPERCAVVEDAPVGIEAARRAGMTAIAITGTAPREKLDAARLVVESLRELTPAGIAGLLNGPA